jgi:hypothetical protein
VVDRAQAVDDQRGAPQVDPERFGFQLLRNAMKAHHLRQGEVAQPSCQQLHLPDTDNFGQQQVEVAKSALHRLLQPSIPDDLRHRQGAQPGCEQFHPPIANKLWGRQVAPPGCRQLQLPGDVVPACRPGGLDHRPKPRSVHARPPDTMRLRRFKDRPSPRQPARPLRQQTGRRGPRHGSRGDQDASDREAGPVSARPSPLPAGTPDQIGAGLLLKGNETTSKYSSRTWLLLHRGTGSPCLPGSFSSAAGRGRRG